MTVKPRKTRRKSANKELLEAQQLLGWIYHRTRAACFSRKRSERDAALSDVNHFTQRFNECWSEPAAMRDPNHVWMGERP